MMVYVRELELRYKRLAVDVDGPLGKKVDSTETVYRLFSYLQDVPQEKFLTIHLDTKNKIQSFREVSAGSLTTGIVDPAEVFRGALLAGVKKIIGVHNHPSGDPTPSQEDKELTESLKEAGEVIGVTLVDHIIVGERCYTSWKEGWHKWQVRHKKEQGEQPTKEPTPGIPKIPANGLCVDKMPPNYTCQVCKKPDTLIWPFPAVRNGESIWMCPACFYKEKPLRKDHLCILGKVQA